VRRESLSGLQRPPAATLEPLTSLLPSPFAGAEERHIVRPLIEGMRIEMSGLQYLREWTFPNFYFHLVTAYAILRHHGIELGKKDYMRHLGPSIRMG